MGRNVGGVSMATKQTKNTAAAIPLDPDHDVDLKGGKFQGTNAAQLAQAFAKFAASGSHHACVFFHGGLVSRADGLTTASQLIGPYTQAGAYPFFFIWNSDFLTVIQELLDPSQHDPAFVAAANRLVVAGANKIASVLDVGATLQRAAKARLHAAPMSLEALAKFAEPYDKVWSRNPGAQLPISPVELADFGTWLLKHKPETEQRGFLTKTKIRGTKNPFGRVIERLNSGHGHGLFTTVIEELYIAIGIADLAAPIWGRMKIDIDAAFTQNADAGGTAFLENLHAAWKRDPNLKVTLIGHSAGAIYLQRFVEAFDELFAAQSTRKVEIVTLAAAVTFERVNQGLAALKRRASGLRLFGLSDKREGGYWEVPGIYNKSLLYIVSSLCEEDPEADKPLVGMQRYWSGKRPYDQPYINAVTDFAESSRTVWAPSANTAKPGYRSDAHRHGGFPTDQKTEESTCYALKNGV
jgi:hypothetical protein